MRVIRSLTSSRKTQLSCKYFRKRLKILTKSFVCSNAVKERHNNHWRDLINVNFGINDITAQPLLDYFRPLEEYLENITTEFITPPPFTAEPPSDLIVTESHRRSIISTTENISDLQSTSEVHANYTTVSDGQSILNEFRR